MVQSGERACKMITFANNGSPTVKNREPRRNPTQYPAVCNDGDRWFLSIAGYERTVERHNIEDDSWG